MLGVGSCCSLLGILLGPPRSYPSPTMELILDGQPACPGPLASNRHAEAPTSPYDSGAVTASRNISRQAVKSESVLTSQAGQYLG